MESERKHTASPVPPEEVFFLLCDFREGVPATDQVELLVVAVSQGVVTRQPVTLGTIQVPRIRSADHILTLCCCTARTPAHLHTLILTQMLTKTCAETHTDIQPLTDTHTQA